ncbi:MAG: trypsin-like peptidase domain-containing protein [Candidatus Vogelbacteria bacterium]|nr:trypsin-like peptidase domain-containing protein [Candidatus Vogelbacteria bacterium]
MLSTDAISIMLGKIALTLQSLLILLGQYNAAPARNAELLPIVQRSLVQIQTTLTSLSNQLSGTTPFVTQSSPQKTVSELNDKTRNATINILCTSNSRNSVRSATASGIVIDRRGVILTNAHVAEYVLLKDYPEQGASTCVVRTGNPAEPIYRVRVLYMPMEWAKMNDKLLLEQKPKGTGENDYALLLITSKIDGTPISNDLPYLTPDEAFDSSLQDSPVIIAGYPAEFTGSIIASMSLNQVSSLSKITGGYYFDPNDSDKLDLINVPGSIASQGGSSGGAVLDIRSGNLVGVIVTTTSGKTTAERELFALTTSYVSRKLKSSTGKNIRQFLDTDLEALAHSFESNSASELIKILTRVLSN